MIQKFTRLGNCKKPGVVRQYSISGNRSLCFYLSVYCERTIDNKCLHPFDLASIRQTLFFGGCLRINGPLSFLRLLTTCIPSRNGERFLGRIIAVDLFKRSKVWTENWHNILILHICVLPVQRFCKFFILCSANYIIY